jgi:hypothetical protein
MKDIKGFAFGIVSTSACIVAIGLGWIGYGWRHQQNRHLETAALANASGVLVVMPLDKLIAPPDASVGDRLDILVNSGGVTVPLVFDSLLIARDVRGCFCKMPLVHGRQLVQAIQNGSTISCRPSVVPGDWVASTD